MDMIQQVTPAAIERHSMEIIDGELAERGIELDERNAAVIKRVIHTSADFDYVENLRFSPGAVDAGIAALKAGATIVTDTNMARAGVSKPSLAKLGGEVVCFMADEDVAQEARDRGTTRAVASMDKAALLLDAPVIAIGNAPTALIRVLELVEHGVIAPRLVIGVPVGFVNVEASKELLMERTDIPWIVARGRKGGSNIAAAICNALLYEATGRQL